MREIINRWDSIIFIIIPVIEIPNKLVKLLFIKIAKKIITKHNGTIEKVIIFG